MKNQVKIIFHIDLNAFYCSCAQIKEPYLKDKVFVVGGSSTFRRGVITTANYKARALGIHSAMNINDALNIYPKLVIVPTDFKLYRKYSKMFFDFLRKYTPLVLAASIDEAYMDVTDAVKDRHPLEFAEDIQKTLHDTIGLPSSIGIAPTLFLAKMASDFKKPMGITVLRKRDIVRKLFPLSIKEMHGIGIKTYPRLIDMGVATIGDFTKAENKEKILTVMTEQAYEGFIDHILGKSSDIVDPDKYAIPKSISNETTLGSPLDHYESVLAIIEEQLLTSYQRLIDEELVTKTVGIKLRDANFKTFTRSFTFNDYTDDYDIIHEQILDLFEKNFNQQPVRLIGASLSQLLLKKDLKIDINLFNYHKFTKRETELYTKKEES